MNWLEIASVGAAIGLSSGLNTLWLGLLITALAAGMLKISPRANATTRHAVWFIALLLIAATPVLLLIPRPAPAAAPLATMIASLPAAAPLAIPVTAQWPMYLVLAWLAFTILMLARVAWSLIHIHGLKRRAAPVGRRDNIRVLASTEVRVPVAAGFVHPAIIFPQSVIAELSSEEFEQVLSHELAHLRRWDDWTQLIQAIIQSVLFFNPAVYWIGRRLKIEREMACDDWVVSATGAARPYAACLTHLHEVTRRAGTQASAPQLAPGALTRHRWQITARIEALLQPDRNSTPRFSRSGWMAACVLAGATLVVAARTTPPVGVQEIPVASMAFVHLSAPSAPVISLAPRRTAVARPRMLARRLPKLEAPAMEAASEAPYVLVRAWQVEVSPAYYVITVVFFEPPPPTALNGI